MRAINKELNEVVLVIAVVCCCCCCLLLPKKKKKKNLARTQFVAQSHSTQASAPEFGQQQVKVNASDASERPQTAITIKIIMLIISRPLIAFHLLVCEFEFASFSGSAHSFAILSLRARELPPHSSAHFISTQRRAQEKEKTKPDDQTATIERRGDSHNNNNKSHSLADWLAGSLACDDH